MPTDIACKLLNRDMLVGIPGAARFLQEIEFFNIEICFSHFRGVVTRPRPLFPSMSSRFLALSRMPPCFDLLEDFKSPQERGIAEYPRSQKDLVGQGPKDPAKPCRALPSHHRMVSVGMDKIRDQDHFAPLPEIMTFTVSNRTARSSIIERCLI